MKGWNEKSPEKWQRLLNAMKDNDMACSCFDIGLNLVQPDSAERAKVLDDCRRQIEYAHTVLNAANVLIYSSKVADGLSNEHCKKLYGEALGEMAEFASQFGINATIEDFDPQPNFVCSAKSCLEVLNIAGPKAKLCFDTGSGVLLLHPDCVIIKNTAETAAIILIAFFSAAFSAAIHL